MVKTALPCDLAQSIKNSAKLILSTPIFYTFISFQEARVERSVHRPYVRVTMDILLALSVLTHEYQWRIVRDTMKCPREYRH